ncbi:MAG: phosphoribosylformylglycinamidine synthase subunit PurQ [Chloroflexota bacterium]
MKFAVVVFPGSNCDHDAHFATGDLLGGESVKVWHKDPAIPAGVDCVVLPGGFSYGDYLRSGAIARFSPVMRAVGEFAKKGGLVLGICNGFQILVEAGLLEGALMKNANLSFICKDVWLKVENHNTPFTQFDRPTLRIPVAHGDGNYIADEETIKALESEGRVVFRYSNESGEVTSESNINGSVNNIAGIINRQGNVLGMMPHPERYSDGLVGGDDGLLIFKSIEKFIGK